MLPSRLSLALFALLPLFVSAGRAPAQRPSVGVEPLAGWLTPGSYFDFEHSNAAVDTRTVLTARIDAAPVIGVRLVVAPPGWRWRPSLDYSRSASEMRFRHLTSMGMNGDMGTQVDTRDTSDATIDRFTLAAERAATAGAFGIELTLGAVMQKLTTEVALHSPDVPRRQRGRYTDWGLVTGAAVGPRGGWARGARVGLLFTAIAVGDEMYQDVRSTSIDPASPGTHFQLGVSALIGWRVTF